MRQNNTTIDREARRNFVNWYTHEKWMRNTSYANFFKGEYVYKFSEYLKSQHNFSMIIHEVSSYSFDVDWLVGCDMRATSVNWPCLTVSMN